MGGEGFSIDQNIIGYWFFLGAQTATKMHWYTQTGQKAQFENNWLHFGSKDKVKNVLKRLQKIRIFFLLK